MCWSDPNPATPCSTRLVGERCDDVIRDGRDRVPHKRTPVHAGEERHGGGGLECRVPVLPQEHPGAADRTVQQIPDRARVGHVGLYRDPDTLKPVEYYMKMPHSLNERLCIVVDPMLATGNSAAAAVQKVKDAGAKKVKFVCLLAAPEGINSFQKAHPDVPIVTAAIDRELNDHGYIMPGLGDAGDRMYGTK